MKKINKKIIKSLIPKRENYSNKTDFGKTLIIGGEKKHIGAALLAALAATKSGSGYIYLMSDLEKFDLLKYPDFILSKFSVKTLNDKNNFSIAIGPGLGTDSKKILILKYLIKNKFSKVVVDADGLAILSRFKNVKLPSSWILTPHEGEMMRLLNKKVKVKVEDRINFALELHRKFKCHILLKGKENIFINSNGEVYASQFGNVVLAKAGTGDVLTGIIAAHLNFGLSPIEAMLVSSYIHAEAGNMFLKAGNSNKSLRPTDLLENIPKVI